MELTSKQRAQLRGLANSIDTILQVGKDGIGANLIKQADDALEARELIKGRVLDNNTTTPAPPRRSWPRPPAARWCRSSARSSCCTGRATPSPGRSASSW